MGRYPRFRQERSSWAPPGQRNVGCVATAEDGTWGFGMTDYGRPTAAMIDDVFAPRLIGEEVFATEKLYDLMVRIASPLSAQGVAAYATSAIDLALWDLKGKLLGEPVYRLLGGPAHDEMPLYATGNNVAWAKELGFQNFKRACRFGPAEGTDGINRNEEDIARTRELIGPDADLMLDCWLSMDVEYAVRLAEKLRPYDLRWLEDCVLADSIDEWPRLRQRIPWQGVATGEHWSTVYPFFHAASEGLVDVLQPDILWCGGLTALVKICHIAEAAGIAVIPHGGGGTAYGQHACWGLSGVPMIECSGPVMTEPGVPLEEKDRLPGTPVPSEGRLHPSDAPGFGLELKREWLPGFFS
ncbi:MAG: L-rhamnonate dehydratase [Chloroflexi bacterium]|nr:L-rhamnonate dehydratase [Chloroflexota bacterium]